MTVTGWDNGLSQDYNKKLAQWFMSKPGAMHELRSQFMTTRTELIARLNGLSMRLHGTDYAWHRSVITSAADMLEADEKAARLALDSLEKSTKYFNIVRLGESRLKDSEIRGANHAAIAALKEVL